MKNIFRYFTAAARAERKLLTGIEKKVDLETFKGLVQNVIDNGGNIDSIGNFGSALGLVLFDGDMEKTEALLKCGVNMDAPTYLGTSPLVQAIVYNKQKMVEFLIDHGSNIDGPDNNGLPLRAAISKNNPQTIQLLIDKGANKEAKDCRGRIPLYDAIFFGHLEAVNVLLKNKVDLNLTDNFIETPLDFSIFWATICAYYKQHKSARARLNVCRALIAAGAETDFLPFEVKHLEGEKLEFMASFASGEKPNRAKNLSMIYTKLGILQRLVEYKENLAAKVVSHQNLPLPAPERQKGE